MSGLVEAVVYLALGWLVGDVVVHHIRMWLRSGPW